MVTMGRIVRYVHVQPCDGQPDVSPAIVSRVRPNGAVDLHVFFSIGDFIKTDVTYDANKGPDTWHWPAIEVENG